MSFALADKINIYRKERELALKNLSAAHVQLESAHGKLEDYAQNLEEKVKERTIRLHEANAELTAQNEEIQSQNEAIIEQKEEIEAHRDELAKKNTMITDSINYARRIQDAILPSDAAIKKAFPDSFLLYLPKDIVSGDFYWLTCTENYDFIAVADCTGHGVPGAFMSMIGNSLLNEIVKEKKFTSPSKILGRLNIRVKEALLQGGKSKMQADGMDITICRISKDRKEAVIASANQNVIYKQNKQVKTIEGDMYSIGGVLSIKEDMEFIEYRLKLNDGMTLYLYSDGIIDQFGEVKEKEKKFSTQRLIKLIKEYADKPLKEQGKIFHLVFEKWMGNKKQLDDVLIIGINI